MIFLLIYLFGFPIFWLWMCKLMYNSETARNPLKSHEMPELIGSALIAAIAWPIALTLIVIYNIGSLLFKIIGKWLGPTENENEPKLYPQTYRDDGTYM